MNKSCKNKENGDFLCRSPLFICILHHSKSAICPTLHDFISRSVITSSSVIFPHSSGDNGSYDAILRAVRDGLWLA